jgi:hypothetical protein
MKPALTGSNRQTNSDFIRLIHVAVLVANLIAYLFDLLRFFPQLP